MHGNEIVQYLQNYKRHESGKGHSRKPLYSSTSYIQLKNTKTKAVEFSPTFDIQMTFLMLFFEKSCKTTPFRKSTEVWKQANIILIGPRITKWRPSKNVQILCFFGGSFFQKKLLTFGIFNESNIWAKVCHIWKIEV